MKSKKFKKKLALNKKTIANLKDAESYAVKGGEPKPTTPLSICLHCVYETQFCPTGSCHIPC